ncbi:MAG: tRNA lysidine(34) synthetase TilS [Clostridia bacterium]|nr:tRNA lysidine(34) synthetase TilS [Clostridia bacterium]
MCLFNLLKEAGCKIYAVHVNHNLRPGACDEDEKYVRDLCEKSGVECFVTNVKVSTEEEGRKARYEAFKQCCDVLCSRGIDRKDIRIAVAHNKEDQAETILFRILRGTGIDGLRGMDPEREDENGNVIIRPLIDTSRKDIEEYCKEKGLSPRIDETNSKPIYTRNKIRLELIPYLQEKFNSNIVDTLTRLGKAASMDREYLLSCAREKYDGLTYDISYLRQLDKAVLHRIYMMALREIGLDEDITMSHMQAIDKVVFEGAKAANLPKDIRVHENYGKLSFVQHLEKEDWNMSVISYQEYQAKEKGVHGAFCIDDLDENLISLRTRREGDYIPVKNGRKKLQDFFVDEKIPKEFREDMLLLAYGSEILWVLPSKVFEKGRYCGKYGVKEDSKKVLFVEKS